MRHLQKILFLRCFFTNCSYVSWQGLIRHDILWVALSPSSPGCIDNMGWLVHSSLYTWLPFYNKYLLHKNVFSHFSGIYGWCVLKPNYPISVASLIYPGFHDLRKPWTNLYLFCTRYPYYTTAATNTPQVPLPTCGELADINLIRTSCAASLTASLLSPRRSTVTGRAETNTTSPA